MASKMSQGTLILRTSHGGPCAYARPAPAEWTFDSLLRLYEAEGDPCTEAATWVFCWVVSQVFCDEHRNVHSSGPDEAGVE